VSRTDRRTDRMKPTPRQVWIGCFVGGIPALLLSLDAIAKLLALAPVIEGTTQLGYQPGVIVPLGFVLLACVVVYIVPRTAPIGAVLLTGYLGGAIATHVRVGNPLFTHILVPVYVAAMLWGGLFLRDARVRVLVGGTRRISDRETEPRTARTRPDGAMTPSLASRS
jgi:hypothetical protein